MIGNISKSKGFKGDAGAIGPAGPTGPAGPQGEKGDSPYIVLRLDDSGNLYYSSDGILIDKEYVESQNLVTKDKVNELTTFVINLDASFAGDKTYDEIVTAHNDGKEIIGVMPDMNITFRFVITACTTEGVQLITQMANLVLTISCTADNVWSIRPTQLVSDIQLNNTLESTINNKISGFEKTENRTIQITENSTSNEYPTAKAVYNLVKTRVYDLQTQIDALQEDISYETNRNNSQELRIGSLENSEKLTQESLTNIYRIIAGIENNGGGSGAPTCSYVRILGGIDNWEAEDVTDSTGKVIGSRYGQVVNVNNAVITPNSKVDLQISSEQMVIFYEKDLAFVAENEDGVVTIYCIGNVPENDYTLQATVTEVTVNE